MTTNYLKSALFAVVLTLVCGWTACGPQPLPGGGGSGLVPGDGEGRPSLVRTITCDGETGDGAHRVFHQVLRYADGSATSTCSIRGTEGAAEGSGSYSYGQTGQPGADCFMDLGGSRWRATLAQDEANTIISQRQAWLIPCTGGLSAQFTK